MSDLETRLRAIRELLPDPDERATENGRRAMHAARASAPWATGRRRSWFASRGPRTYLIAAALALVIGGGALAAALNLGGLPAFGRDPEQAFVAPRTDILPGGYERSRPPRMDELPSRPSLRFPEGTTYTEALAAYYAARRRGDIVPPGADLAAPLPEGKVVVVEDGRVSLDPAAPIGYNPATGLVGVLSGAPAGPISIARCEVLLGRNDPNSGSCGDGTHLRFISEGVAGRWLPSEVGGIPARVVGSDRLSILNRPLQAGDGLPADAFGEPFGRFSPSKSDLAHARLAAVVGGGARLYVVPVGRTGVCLAVRGRAADVGSTCNPLSLVTSYGAVFLTSGLEDGRYRYAAIIGDGFDHASGDGGEQVAITNNVFAMDLRPSTDLITITGPAGRYRLRVIGNDPPPTTRNGIPAGVDLSRRRVVLRINLSDGRSETIWRAPRRRGGFCFWSGRFAGCRTAAQPIPIDVVTTGFSAGGPGVPVILSGQLAPQVGALELRYSDGSSQRLTPRQGWILYEVPADHLTKRRMPSVLTTFDREGIALATEPLRFAPIVRQRQPKP